MGDELDAIIQQMIDAGESEENIATVIQDYEATPVDPSAQRKDDAMRFALGQNFDRTPAPVGEILTQQMPTALAAGAALKYGPGLLMKAAKPVVQGAVRLGGAIGDVVSPDIAGVISPRLGKALEVAQKARAALPKPAPTPAQTGAPAAKPRLSAAQTKQMMREQYGAEKGGRMLFGQARPGVTAAARTQLMRSGTSGGALPKSAARAIDRELAGSTADEAFAYAAKAPNAQAASHFGELLKQALQQRMSGK